MKNTTLGELKASGYQPKNIHEELKANLRKKLTSKEPIFTGILGYENTVVPDFERAILSGHSINLLGLRGQAKTKMARQLTGLLDEYIPYIASSEINDEPFAPISYFGKQQITELGDNTPIAWLHRVERYVEKLATPDVSVADLIGDVDPIKAINEKLSYNDERVIHYGIIPRANRCIFVINELPDLQPRIQVALFNILQEGDIQIRGFKMRMALDMQFVFTANPEDYTNRGSIVTPLKDRIGSQILTHYPKTIAMSKSITAQEAKKDAEKEKVVIMHDLIPTLIERLVIEARSSEFVDAKSGVSARLAISALENIYSGIERRVAINNDTRSLARISDLVSIIPAITGKIEMVYEGEQEGPLNVANQLIGKAIRSEFIQHFPNPEKLTKKANRKEGDTSPQTENAFSRITEWFERGKTIELPSDASDKEYGRILNSVDGLALFIDEHMPETRPNEKILWMEFVLHGLSEYSKLSKHQMDEGLEFKDLLGSMLDFSK
ncbi:AAA family ATPase [Bacteroidia bacterium]|nr:AAA family ATPase [Bacteroidia bacterium]MDB4107541.1 AAA family ATPase [Bacteroidia bacterium]MDB9881534.1 AAA family ATPase [Bacteroidia bacterium]MDC1395298.1 AAA family ATPase [Bacteroidia bacterium]